MFERNSVLVHEAKWWLKIIQTVKSGNKETFYPYLNAHISQMCQRWFNGNKWI